MTTKQLQTLECLLYNCKLSKKYFLKKDEINKKMELKNSPHYFL